MRSRFGKKRPVAYAFIDSQNLNLGVQKAGWKMDWRKFRVFLEKKYNVKKAYMFIGYMPENVALYEQMHDSGYAVVLKPTVDMHIAAGESHASLGDAQGEDEKRSKSYTKYGARASEVSTQRIAKGSGQVGGSADEQDTTARVTKGNVDADLVLYAMKEMPNYNKAIIVSGDGDFFGLIEYLEQKNRLLHVMTPNWQYSSLLKPFEKYIVRIDQLRKELSYHDRKKRK